MTVDLQWILESKRALRRDLARRSVSEKLELLDRLRDRLRTIRAAAVRRESTTSRKSEPESRGGAKQT